MIHDSTAAHASTLFCLSLLTCKCIAVQNKPDAVFIGLPPELHGSIDNFSANIEIKLAEVARPRVVRHSSFTFTSFMQQLAYAKQHVHQPAYRHTCWHDGAYALVIKIGLFQRISQSDWSMAGGCAPVCGEAAEREAARGGAGPVSQAAGAPEAAQAHHCRWLHAALLPCCRGAQPSAGVPFGSRP